MRVATNILLALLLLSKAAFASPLAPAVPIPEPATVVLLFVGLMILRQLTALNKRKTHKDHHISHHHHQPSSI